MKSWKPELNVNAKLGLAERLSWLAESEEILSSAETRQYGSDWAPSSSHSPSVLLLRKHLRIPRDTNKRLFSNSRSASAEAKSCQTLASHLSRQLPCESSTNRRNVSVLVKNWNRRRETKKLQFLECDGLSDLVSSVFCRLRLNPEFAKICSILPLINSFWMCSCNSKSQ